MRHVALRNIPPNKDLSGKTTTPLSEPVLLILLSLAPEPRHGYAILKDVERLSDGRVEMSTGTLYGALRRLLADGWIERFQEPQAPRDRQAYRLTGAGRQVVESEVERMKQLTAAASKRLRALPVTRSGRDFAGISVFHLGGARLAGGAKEC